jgi:hypothetical protein
MANTFYVYDPATQTESPFVHNGAENWTRAEWDMMAEQARVNPNLAGTVSATGILKLYSDYVLKGQMPDAYLVGIWMGGFWNGDFTPSTTGTVTLEPGEVQTADGISKPPPPPPDDGLTNTFTPSPGSAPTSNTPVDTAPVNTVPGMIPPAAIDPPAAVALPGLTVPKPAGGSAPASIAVDTGEDLAAAPAPAPGIGGPLSTVSGKVVAVVVVLGIIVWLATRKQGA